MVPSRPFKPENRSPCTTSTRLRTFANSVFRFARETQASVRSLAQTRACGRREARAQARLPDPQHHVHETRVHCRPILRILPVSVFGSDGTVTMYFGIMKFSRRLWHSLWI